MEGQNQHGAGMTAPRGRYAQSETSEKVSDVRLLSMPLAGAQVQNVQTGEEPPPEVNTKLRQALGMVMGYCGMRPEEKAAEDGRKALACSRAVAMIVAYGLPEKAIHHILG